MTDIVIFFDPSSSRWIRLSDPVQVVQANTLNEVLPAIEQATAAGLAGLTSAGFISYEAAPAFESALTTKPAANFPFCRFGLFGKAEPLTLANIPLNPFIVGSWAPSVSKKEYQNNIGEIKRQIAAGQTYQVNYTYRLTVPFSGDACSLFRHLLKSQNTPKALFMEWEDYAMCSLSPELFFRLDGEHIVSRPMKGTASRGRYLQEDENRATWLRASEKNRAENIMIVDMIRNDLGQIAKTGTVKVESLFDVEHYKTAWQMTSTVSAETSATITDIFGALFPCASVTGAPKASTMRIIAGLETTPRKIYTGAMGLIGPGRKARFNVAIRTVLIDKKSAIAEYGVGGGIVWDSDSSDEFTETQTKARILFSPKDDFDLLETILWEQSGGYFLLDYHLSRMRDSATYFGFPFPVKKIKTQLSRLERHLITTTKIRLLLGDNGEFKTAISPFQEIEETPVKLGFANQTVDSTDPMLFHKTTRRSLYEQALSSRPDCDDVILLNEKGQVTETSICNIIVRRERQLVTPARECGLLPGSFRQWLLDQGKIVEGILLPKDLIGDICVINSVRKWRKGILVNS